jgi:hypothetical protein
MELTNLSLIRTDVLKHKGVTLKMITITEKDGATIIVIENPNKEELKIINDAKRMTAGSIFSKFACNRKNKEVSSITAEQYEEQELEDLSQYGSFYD